MSFRPAPEGRFLLLRHPGHLLSLAICLFVFFTVVEAESPAPVTASREGEGGGVLEGRVSVGPELTARKIRFRIYPDLGPQEPPRQEPDFQDELKNVVVYLEAVPWTAPAARSRSTELVMEQVNESFEPHVLPVLKGSSVAFPNGDPFFHNVFSLSLARAFDLGHYPKGKSRSVQFDEPGIVKVFCHLHADMSAVILVLENPFFATPDEDGRYRIEGVPPGRHRAVAWHERARPVSRSVRIEPGRASVEDFRVPIHEISAKD